MNKNKEREEWEIWDSKPVDKIKKPESSEVKYEDIQCGSIKAQNYQVKTINDILKIWDNGFVAICTALTGAGKTYISSLAAKLWGAEYVFIVGPTLSRTKWFDVLEGTGILRENIHFFTYHSIINAGSSDDELYSKNPWLYKMKYQKKAENGTIVSGYDFYPSRKWKQLVNNNKVVLIFDEYHKLQKQSQRSYACSCISRYILGHMNDSRVLCLSYTPNDNPNDIPMNMYLFNLIRTNKLIKYDRKEKLYDVTELKSILNICEMFYKHGTWTLEEKRAITISYPMMINGLVQYRDKSKSKAIVSANKIASELYLVYIKKYIVVTCVADWMLDSKLIPNYNNVFCRVTPNTFNEISQLIGGGSSEKKISKFKHIKDDRDNILMAKLNDMQHKMEKIKTKIYISIAKEILESDNNRKVVIIVLFLDVLDEIATALRDYEPLIMNGKIKQEDRLRRMELFNRHDNRFRLFIATQETGGESIDLHDTSKGGKFPRSFLIPPNFKTKSVVQTAGRGFRQGVTSKCDIMIVYTLHSSFNEEDIKDIPKLSMLPLTLIEESLKPVSINKSSEDMIPEIRFYNTIANKTNTIKRNQAEDQNGKLPFEYEPKIINKIYETNVDRKYFINGYGAPTDATGIDGQYYLDIKGQILYGPKNDTWTERKINVSDIKEVTIPPSKYEGRIGDLVFVTKYNMIYIRSEEGWINYISTLYLHLS